MKDMTQKETEEYMERLSKLPPGSPETFAYSEKQRIQLFAALIYDKIIEDQRNGAPLLRKIERESQALKKTRSTKGRETTQPQARPKT